MTDRVKEAFAEHAPGALAILLLLGAWQWTVQSGRVQFDYLPSPSAILLALWAVTLSGDLLKDTVHTLQATLLGWLIVCVIGITLGAALGYSKTLRNYTLASIELARPLPGVAFVPVALLLFGFSMRTELLVIAIPSLWPILINTMGGVLAIHPRLFDVARMLRFSRVQVFRKILIPAALPSIVVGCRLSLGLALVMAIIAEIVGNPEGLGYAVVREQQAMAPDRMFAYVFAIGILGVVFNAVLQALSRRFVPNPSLAQR
ncbi:MAG: binding-protein-dependent transport system inner rane component [Herminiimonas sp.]|nr:binding-protein-dependent transport system inner rane component [Herminiimonas sp.]MDB5855794.1 binding-protein-dependent transport system inner rane component [Herminiimonas sp.]